jgi:hypothetical protein
VINFRVCGIAAGLAFVLSLIFGIIAGNGFLTIFLRALLFGGVFFGLFALGGIVVSRFLPELLSESGGDEFDIPAPGSRVDISVGAPVEGAFPEDVSEALDDIGGRPSAVRKQTAVSPLDQNEDNGYNEEADYSGSSDDSGSSGDFVDFATPEAETVRETARGEGGGSGGEGVLPDMDNLSAEASAPEQGMEVESFSSPEPMERYSSSKKKPPPIAENFDAKQLAKAIQTALKKDEKG